MAATRACVRRISTDSCWRSRHASACRLRRCCWRGSPRAQLLAGLARGVGDGEVRAAHRGLCGAGFRKIHLDCSMSCAGDPAPLCDAEVAARGCACARCRAYLGARRGEAPVYVGGHRSAVPGGAQENLAELQLTEAAAPRHRGASAGLQAAGCSRRGRALSPGRAARRRVRS